MARDPALPVRVATIILLAVAFLTCELASQPTGVPTVFGLVVGGVLLLAATLLAVFVRPPSESDRVSPLFMALLVGGLLLPVATESLLRDWLNRGDPFEMQMVNGLRSAGLLLAGLGAVRRFRRLAGVVALFLALFAAAMGDQPQVPYLLAVLALLGGLWLVLENVAARAGEASAVATGELAERVPLTVPYRELAVFGVLAVLAGAVALAGPKRVMFTLGELMPTSGGTGDTDPFARYGVGDGPEEVAGENARAAGMVESDRMIEDNKDALVDVVSDLYGPPHKPRKDRDRMVAGGVAEVIQNHGKLPDNRKPSRDFDTGRKGLPPKTPPGSQAARGLFEVEGRTPLHVRVLAYETYDPAAHRWLQADKPVSHPLTAAGGDWMAATHLRTVEWYAADDRHRLKVAALKDNFVPTPAMLTAVRIQRVDKPEYYAWDFDGVLALAGRRKTPPGVVVNTDCRTVDPAVLPREAFATGTSSPFEDFPEPVHDAIARLANEWAGTAPRGWPQIDAVLTKLRTEYTHDRTAAAPSGHPAPVLWFLTESRRGPDYLFATSAALLLRVLNYPARVCLGYYAAPENFDPETDHTPVKAGDLHLWPEVRLADGHWLVLEPTPGYATLPPRKPWKERLLDSLRAAAAWAERRATLVAVGVAGLAFLLWKRRRAADVVRTLRWRWFPGPSWQARAARTAKLLETRAALAGAPRPAAQTLAAWANGLSPDTSLAAVVRLAEWAAYAPGLPPPVPDGDVAAICSAAVSAWPYRRFLPDRSGASA